MGKTRDISKNRKIIILCLVLLVGGFTCGTIIYNIIEKFESDDTDTAKPLLNKIDEGKLNASFEIDEIDYLAQLKSLEALKLVPVPLPAMLAVGDNGQDFSCFTYNNYWACMDIDINHNNLMITNETYQMIVDSRSFTETGEPIPPDFNCFKVDNNWACVDIDGNQILITDDTYQMIVD